MICINLSSNLLPKSDKKLKLVWIYDFVFNFISHAFAMTRFLSKKFLPKIFDNL